MSDIAKSNARDSRREEFAAVRASMARHTIPDLIELLASPELKTRFLAEMCLRDATGT